MIRIIKSVKTFSKQNLTSCHECGVTFPILSIQYTVYNVCVKYLDSFLMRNINDHCGGSLSYYKSTENSQIILQFTGFSKCFANCFVGFVCWADFTSDDETPCPRYIFPIAISLYDYILCSCVFVFY